MSDRTVERLARYAAHLTFVDLPAEVVHQTKRVLIDSLGCGLGAVQSEPARIIRELAGSRGGEEQATLLGTDTRTTPDWVAFHNGTLVRYLDFNDAYTGSHPSDNFAAVLAAAEAYGASGQALIAGCALAYEVQGAWADTFSLGEDAWDQTVYACSSMPLGVGKVMGLDEEQLAEALRISVVSGIALNETRRGRLSHWKAAAVPNVGRNAVVAALLARGGFTGPDAVYEGAQGFFAGITRRPLELAPLAGEGGNAKPFRILESRIKRFPSVIYSQTAIEGALEARAALGIQRGDDVRDVHVGASAHAIASMAGHPSRWQPETRETADHSLPFLIACALEHGTVEPSHFTDAELHAPRMVALMQRVRADEDAACQEAWPEASPSLVTVETTDGRRHTARVTYHLGHARRPVADGDVEAKFRGLARDVLSDAQQSAALEALWRVDQASDLRRLLALFAAPSSGA
jgi:2-methylcitrate dehydratase